MRPPLHAVVHSEGPSNNMLFLSESDDDAAVAFAGDVDSVKEIVVVIVD